MARDYESSGLPLKTNPIPIFRAGINLRRLLQKGVALGDKVNINPQLEARSLLTNYIRL